MSGLESVFTDGDGGEMKKLREWAALGNKRNQDIDRAYMDYTQACDRCKRTLLDLSEITAMSTTLPISLIDCILEQTRNLNLTEELDSTCNEDQA